MILSKYGIEVTEEALRAEMPSGGAPIEDLADLAKKHGLHAEIISLDLDQLAELLSVDTFPIVYLNRVHFDRPYPVARRFAVRRSIVHAVIPLYITGHFVVFNDPRQPKRRRVSRKKFAAAHRDLSNWCVVCKLT